MPTLHHFADFSGYYYEDIVAFLGERSKHFQKWIDGQTCAVIGGKTVVYAEDYNRYIKGLPVID